VVYILISEIHLLTIPTPSFSAFIKNSIQIGCGNAITGSTTFSPLLKRCYPALTSNFAGFMILIPYLLMMI
jgi:hypothetical protein